MPEMPKGYSYSDPLWGSAGVFSFHQVIIWRMWHQECLHCECSVCLCLPVHQFNMTKDLWVRLCELYRVQDNLFEYRHDKMTSKASHIQIHTQSVVLIRLPFLITEVVWQPMRRDRWRKRRLAINTKDEEETEQPKLTEDWQMDKCGKKRFKKADAWDSER